MKLLLVANGYPPTAYGGVEIYVSSIATELLSKGHTVAVFCREANEHLPDGHVLTEKNGGLRIIRVVNDYKTISSIVETYLDSNIKRIFAEWLQTEAPDVIHFNHWIALSADLPSIAVRAGIPSVATLHDYWAICQRVHLLDWHGKRCLGPMQGGDCFQCVLKHGFQRQWLRIPFQVLKRFFKGSGKAKVKELLRWRSDSSGFLSGTRLDFVGRAKVFHDNLGLCKSILAPSEFVRNIFRVNGYRSKSVV